MWLFSFLINSIRVRQKINRWWIWLKNKEKIVEFKNQQIKQKEKIYNLSSSVLPPMELASSSLTSKTQASSSFFFNDRCLPSLSPIAPFLFFPAIRSSAFVVTRLFLLFHWAFVHLWYLSFEGLIWLSNVDFDFWVLQWFVQCFFLFLWEPN